MKKKKVIILGAGPAGLTAAYDLLKKSHDYEVIVVEELDQVGGISKTIETKGNRMDLGGHRFFTKQKRVMDFWTEILPIQGKETIDEKELGVTQEYLGKTDPEKENKVFLKRRRVSRIYYRDQFFDYPLKLNFQTIKNMGFITTFLAGCSYLKSKVIKKKEDSLENFYINRFGKKLYSMFFEGYTEKVWGRSPKEIDASWGSQRVKGLSIVGILKDNLRRLFHSKAETKETSLIESFYYPKYGPGQMWETVKDKVVELGGVFLPNHKVIKINWEKNKITSVVCLVGKEKVTLEGDYVFSSIAIKDFINALTKVPKQVHKIADNLPYRDFVTVGVLLKDLKLKNKTKLKTIQNRIPDCWIYIHNKNVEVGRMQIFNNWSPYLVKDFRNTVFVGLEYFCEEGDGRFERSIKEWEQLAIEELQKMDFINEEDILDCHAEKVKKAYPAYFDSYHEIEKVITYLNQFDNLYCIGRNGQHRYNNMDHSMMTGFVAVDHLLKDNFSKKIIWDINTEKDYYEESVEDETAI